jgi:hypothetical protein
MNRRLALLCAVSALTMLGACATATLDPQLKSSIRSVAIARQIELPAKPIVFGDKAGAAFLVGGAIGTSIEQKGSGLPEQFVQLLAAQRIDVRETTRTALRAQLATRGFKVVDDETQADAVVRVSQFGYGMTGDILFGDGKRFPLLAMRIDLVRRGGESSVWRSVVSSNTVEDINKQLEARSLQDYFSDPALLRREHDKIATLVAERLTRGL